MCALHIQPAPLILHIFRNLSSVIATWKWFPDCCSFTRSTLVSRNRPCFCRPSCDQWRYCSAELLVSSSLIIFPFSALTLLIGRREGHPVCKKLILGLLMVTIWQALCKCYSFSCHHHLHHSDSSSRGKITVKTERENEDRGYIYNVCFCAYVGWMTLENLGSISVQYSGSIAFGTIKNMLGFFY